MSTITFRGCTSSTPIDRTKRYRITWKLAAAFLLPNSGFQTYSVSEVLRGFLPSVGLIPISPNISVDGQVAIVYACQLGPLFTGRATNQTVNEIAQEANNLPLFTSGISLRLALDVIEIECYSPAGSVADRKGLDAALARAIPKVESEDIANIPANIAKGAGDIVDKGFDTVQVVAIAIIVVAAVYAYAKYKG